ncbi:MAG TPA: C39 family peptidase [Verrucomicrobiota bacterium]|nr:C39 family peptidase [Verrucomicrobiota bacterium]HQL77281.1 C39 family peptidase [Verrucomicrobiota bacterium]
MNRVLHLAVVWSALAALGLSLCRCHAASAPDAAAQTGPLRPLDSRLKISARQFHKTADGSWETRAVTPEFAFDELIYSWHLRVAPGEGFRLYLRVRCENGDYSPWLYGGCWGKVKPASKRTEPVFEWGKVAMDQLLLKRKTASFQFRVVDEGDSPLSQPPAFSVVVTDNSPTPALAKRYAPRRKAATAPARILDLPLRRQADSQGNAIPDRCQSAALATAMEYFGKPIGLEDIVPLTFDVEYDYPGIWPRTIGAAIQHGFEAYIDRFRDWDSVRKTVAENKVILCSIKMLPGQYKAPPYPQMGGHIVALNGVTDDGRVVVTDSALWKSGRGYRLQWFQEDFEKVWMQTKGGVGMVICPPAGARPKLVPDLPPFPEERLGAKPVASPGEGRN